MRRVFFIISFFAVCSLMLCSCDAVQGLLFGKDSGDSNGTGVTGSDNPNSFVIGVPEDELDFDMQAGDTPVFGDVGDPVENTVDESDASNSEDLYIEKDGYAYRLDPVTLDPIDQPLDPVTKEPVANYEQNQNQNIISDSSDENGIPSETPSAVAPTDENKYPNTGIFLEDD